MSTGSTCTLIAYTNQMSPMDSIILLLGNNINIQHSICVRSLKSTSNHYLMAVHCPSISIEITIEMALQNDDPYVASLQSKQ